MIRIGDYGIKAGEKCYTVGKIVVNTNKETGAKTEVLANPAYHSNIPGCIKVIRRRMQLETLMDFEGSLDLAVENLQILDENFSRLLKELGMDKYAESNI
jgi:hypothetical protein